MSLFGTSPPPARQTAKSSLFDDDDNNNTTSKPTSAGLFADDSPVESSPWDFPNPKKGARRDLVKTLLPANEVPEAYVDAFDNLQQGGSVSAEVVGRLIGEAGVGGAEQGKVREILGGGDVGRGEFNVLLALLGLAQEGDEVGLDEVDERRKRLPIPTLSSLKSASQARPENTAAQSQASSGASGSRAARKQSFGFNDPDPWASPALHKGHNHETENGSGGYSNGLNGSTATVPTRTTSTFTTSAAEQPDTSSSTVFEAPRSAGSNSEGSGWGGAGFTGGQSEGFSNAEEGFDGSGAGDNAGLGGRNAPVRANKGISGGVEETVTVNVLDGKEGVFLFQHRNYEVASVRRNSKVIRRYSDFVWLLDCLHKKYPFRQLPLLPPKRVAINGNHIAADTLFIEKRRRGLARFANALVRHPVLREEQLVIMFLTVPTELAVWRKQATVSVQEEFVGKNLPPGLEDSLPSTLQDLFDTVRSGVRRSAEIYINLCTMMERLAKRNEGLAAEYLRFGLALQSLTEVSTDTYAIDTNDVELLNEGLKSTAKHLGTNQALLEDEARAWDLGVLEDLKRQRDSLVSMRDMFDRRDRYSKDNIPQCERRIASNEAKLAGIRARPEGQVRPGDAEKVEEAIIKDKQSIVAQHARGVFIKECIRDEILVFQHSQYHVSRLHQEWSQERVKYAELGADNWRALSEEVEGMPLGD